MRDRIMSELAQSARAEYYVFEESEEEFRGYFVTGAHADSFARGIRASSGKLAACGVGTFRASELTAFREFIPEEFKGAVGCVELIQVEAEFRGRGFQSVLFQDLERIFRERGAKALFGVVSPFNLASLKNFQKAGYLEQERFYLPKCGYQRIKMRKILQ